MLSPRLRAYLRHFLGGQCFQPSIYQPPEQPRHQTRRSNQHDTVVPVLDKVGDIALGLSDEIIHTSILLLRMLT
ncbi:hypothetical protein Vpro01_03443 [Vibrio proteolyticus]